MEDTFGARGRYWSEKAPFLSRWLWVLFWLVIPQSLASLLSGNILPAEYDGLLLLGQAFQLIYYLGCGLVLLKLSPLLSRYRTAGVCYAAGGVVSAAAALLPVSDDAGGLAMAVSLASLLGTLALLAAEYQECMGHSELVEELNPDLSRQWRRLWKLFIGCYAALFVSVLLLAFSALLALFVTLAGTLGLLAVMILKLIYLYRTTSLFRRLAREIPEP